MTFPPQQYQPQPGYPPQQQGFQGQPQPGYPPQQQQGFAGQPQQAPVPQGATQSVDDFFAHGSAGAPSFDFAQPGAQVVGTIVDMQVRQQTKISAPGEPKVFLFFDDGTPRFQLEITLQTQLSGWQGVKNVPTAKDQAGNDVPKPPSEDDGKRRIYVRYKLKDAVDKALAAAGKTAPAVGDQLAVRWSGQEPNKMGGNPIKLYEAVLRPGAPQADAFFGGGQQQAAPPAQQGFAAPAPAPSQAFPGQQPVYDPRQAYAQPTGEQQQFQQQAAPPAQQQAAPPAQQGSPWGAGEPPF